MFYNADLLGGCEAIRVRNEVVFHFLFFFLHGSRKLQRKLLFATGNYIVANGGSCWFFIRIQQGDHSK